MATTTGKQDSNLTGLRYAEEDSLGVLPGTPVWNPLEPNSYTDFGGQISTVARNPINASRQNQKGVTVDLDASGGFSHDFVLGNLQDILQGFMFADVRVIGEEEPTNVDGVSEEYDVASTTGFLVGNLIFAEGFTNTENNGLKTVNTVNAATSIAVDEDLVAETPPSGAKITVVGFEAAQGDIDVDASGALPALTSTVLDFTTLGLIPGQWIWIGGDTAGTSFDTAANNGFARIRTIAANTLTLDKTDSTLVTEDNSATSNATIQLFYGKVLKNENDPDLIVCRSYQLERTLGEDANGDQAEYIVGAVPNELTVNYATADKVTMDMTFVGTDHEQRDGATGLKSGTRPTLNPEDAFNTTNDFSRLRMSIVSDSDAAPDALFAYIETFSLTINNNVTPNKAISVLGAFAVTPGQFDVGGSATAYFYDVAATQAVRNNADVSFDYALVKNNQGTIIDVPLIALGDGRLDVTQNEAIKLPLEMPAGEDPNFNHTLLLEFFPYLPDAADV